MCWYKQYNYSCNIHQKFFEYDKDCGTVAWSKRNKEWNDTGVPPLETCSQESVLSKVDPVKGVFTLPERCPYCTFPLQYIPLGLAVSWEEKNKAAVRRVQDATIERLALTLGFRSKGLTTARSENDGSTGTPTSNIMHDTIDHI